jgi:Ca2+-binding EF-hand superfamily protein
MRESFSVLDRNNSGSISPQDVSQALSDLGLDSSSSTLSTYFAPGAGNLNLGSYLSTMTRDFLKLDRREQLVAAFSAFDADDSGQIGVAELRDALLSTFPTDSEGGRSLSAGEIDMVLEGFTGKRVLKKGEVHVNGGGLGRGGEVFRYGDWMSGIYGTGKEGAAG